MSRRSANEIFSAQNLHWNEHLCTFHMFSENKRDELALRNKGKLMFVEERIRRKKLIQLRRSKIENEKLSHFAVAGLSLALSCRHKTHSRKKSPNRDLHSTLPAISLSSRVSYTNEAGHRNVTMSRWTGERTRKKNSQASSSNAAKKRNYVNFLQPRKKKTFPSTYISLPPRMSSKSVHQHRHCCSV